MIDAVEQIAERAKQAQHVKLLEFLKFHRTNPELLTFLIDEIDLVVRAGHRAFSFPSLCHYARWKLIMRKEPGATFVFNDHVAQFYGRIIVILRPDTNGLCEFRKSRADEILGLEFAPHEGKNKRYGRRLRWADGTSLEHGWRPTLPIRAAVARRRPDIH